MPNLKGNNNTNYKHGMLGTRIYRIWSGMIQRCTNKNRDVYERYGKKGIIVCERWTNFENFYEDMGGGYYVHCAKNGEKNTTIERIDSEEGYYAWNCKWATYGEQNSNRNNKKTYNYNGVELNIGDLSKIVGIPKTTLFNRLNRQKKTVYEAIKFSQPQTVIDWEKLYRCMYDNTIISFKDERCKLLVDELKENKEKWLHTEQKKEGK